MVGMAKADLLKMLLYNKDKEINSEIAT